MNRSFGARYWATLSGRTGNPPPRGSLSFGRRYLATLLGVPLRVSPREKAERVPVNRRASFGPLLVAMSIVSMVTLSVWYFSPIEPSLPQTPAQPIEIGPAQVVILVDESGSISEADMVRERQAAALIALSGLSSRTAVAVLGFGSSNGPGTSAVDAVCPMTVLDGAAAREEISYCIGSLRRRGPDEGDGTDHAAALQQALAEIGKADSDRKIVFLLTDGRLDVGDDPAYGSTPEERQAAARQLLDQTVAEARDNHVQIWPIGFGSVDAAALNSLAAGGYQGSCPRVPRATVVATSADVIAAAAEATSASQCVVLDPPQDARPKTDDGFPFQVPADAAAIAVTITGVRDPVAVTLIDPFGQETPSSGQVGDSTFEEGGEPGQAEVRRVLNPTPGTWTIRIGSPETTTVTVTWSPMAP